MSAEYLLYILLFVLGAIFGSFAGVLIERLPQKASILGRSKCESCHKALTPLDLFPIISFVFLKGKCRYCKIRLPATYLLYEIGFGLLFLAVFMYYPIIDLWLYLPLYYGLIILVITDIKSYYIPNLVIFPLIMLAGFRFIMSHNITDLVSVALIFLFFLLIILLTKGKGMGGGDLWLSLLIALSLPYPENVITIYLAFVTGGIFAFTLLIFKKAHRKQMIPFGPFLILSLIVVMLFGDFLLPYFLFLTG